MAKHLVLFLNSADLFLSHRQHLARGAEAAGYQVTVLCPPGPAVAEVVRLGYACATVPLGRKSASPLGEGLALLRVYRVLRQLKPDVLHNFTIKPDLYGTLAGRALGVARIINTVTGLGYVFIDQNPRARILRALLTLLYPMVFRSSRVWMTFQNGDDLEFFRRRGWADSSLCSLIPGTGVDTERFRPHAKTFVHMDIHPHVHTHNQTRTHLDTTAHTDTHARTRILFAGRYLKDKGLGELVSACSQLWSEGLQFQLLLCGRLDPGNPNSFTESEMGEIRRQPFVTDLGFRTDMDHVYPDADIVCLPSYREGLPLTLIEASACGKPLVATDVPGCRDVVRAGENGILVPVRNAAALAEGLRQLLLDSELRDRMGTRARDLAVERFEKQRVVQMGIELYANAPKSAA
ncbi:MAG: glycosyltransferase family 4 protein [Bdellovibrionales bacterium]